LLQKGGTVVSEVYFTEGDKMAKETKKEKQKINIDGTEYDSDQLSDKAKILLDLFRKLTRRLLNFAFNLIRLHLLESRRLLTYKKKLSSNTLFLS
jgi:hypothetical protein